MEFPMKASTTVMTLKGVGLVGGTMVSSLVGGLSQWATALTSPTKIQWVIIGGTTLGAGLSALVAFLSTSYGDWSKDSLPPSQAAQTPAGQTAKTIHT
jgi:hypothetical protein